MALQYQKATQKLLNTLNHRQKEVIERRFGLERAQKETLDEIGQDYSICRERVRQIQKQAILKLASEMKRYQEVFQHLQEQIENWGGLKREDKLIENLEGQKFANQILFLLHLGKDFERKKEDREFYTLWLTSRNAIPLARKTVSSLENFLKKEKSLFSLEELFTVAKKKISVPSKIFHKNAFLSFVEATKKIEQGPTGQFGLSFWPEVSPRGVKDRAYLVLKLENKPFHFQDITRLINELFSKREEALHREALPQTVHNELIKDPRFVLVGRGLYALREWGFEEGTVKDIILKILAEKKKPLDKGEIVQAVSKQRLVKENTILLALSDKKYFQRNPQGKYTLNQI